VRPELLSVSRAMLLKNITYEYECEYGLSLPSPCSTCAARRSRGFACSSTTEFPRRLCVFHIVLSLANCTFSHAAHCLVTRFPVRNLALLVAVRHRFAATASFGIWHELFTIGTRACFRRNFIGIRMGIGCCVLFFVAQLHSR